MASACVVPAIDPRVRAAAGVIDGREHVPVVVTGREAPAPALLADETGPRPAPDFIEWLMGLPKGWLTTATYGLTANQQTTAFGNAVLSLQAAYAIKAALRLHEQYRGSAFADRLESSADDLDGQPADQ